MEYVTAVPTNAKPAKNGHIFLPSRAAVRKNDSDAYGIVLFVIRCCLCVCVIQVCASWGKSGGDRRERAALFSSCFAAKSSKFFSGKKLANTEKKSSYEEVFFIPLSRASHTRIDRSIGLIFLTSQRDK